MRCHPNYSRSHPEYMLLVWEQAACVCGYAALWNISAQGLIFPLKLADFWVTLFILFSIYILNIYYHLLLNGEKKHSGVKGA